MGPILFSLARTGAAPISERSLFKGWLVYAGILSAPLHADEQFAAVSASKEPQSPIARTLTCVMSQCVRSFVRPNRSDLD